jgi:hypothetical protein
MQQCRWAATLPFAKNRAGATANASTWEDRRYRLMTHPSKGHQ